MEQQWMPYIPRYVLDDMIARADESPVGREQQFSAVAMFADISGFTALSEALGKTGKTGTEELTHLLNRYFTAMIRLIQSYGGMVAKFGGDGLTVFFPYTNNEQDRVLTIERSIQSALTMQHYMSHYANITTSAGTFTLFIRIGLAVGVVRCCVVGDPALRLEYIVMGTVLNRVARGQQLAQRGEVVVYNDMRSLLPPNTLSCEPCTDEYSRVVQLHPFVIKKPLAALPHTLPPSTRRWIESFIHPAIALRLSKQQRDLINEHRKVTVLFVQFHDFDYDGDPAVVSKLQTYLTEVFWNISRYDGYVRQVDMGDKGSKYIVLFGAPVSHENDEERALRCALELQHVQSIATNIGIATGFVYCGLIGSPNRQEYAVVGDTVNLSARLMQAAPPGHILVSDSTYHEVQPGTSWHTPFVWEPMEPLTVKGKAEPVTIYALRGIQQRKQSHLHALATSGEMVGRQAELERATHVMHNVFNQRGHIIGITAEAGMGKSRLIAEIVRRAELAGFDCFLGECLSYATTNSYLVWQEIFYGMFELDPTWHSVSQVYQVQNALEHLNPQFVARMPLLNAVLNIPIPDNDLTRTFDSRTRKEALESLLVDIISKRVTHKPLLLVLEDCHWIDPLSHELLTVIARSIIDQPVLMVVAYRPPESTPVPLHIRTLIHFSEIRLQELTISEGTLLIEQRVAALYHTYVQAQSHIQTYYSLDTSPTDAMYCPLPTQDVYQHIMERSQGNPFYIDAILSYMFAQGVDLNDSASLHAIELPDSLNSLIMSRIDQLPEGPKNTLRVASVIGQRFHMSWLWRVYPQLGSPDWVNSYLDNLSQLELTLTDSSAPDFVYLFKHVLTQEVAYESLSVATRNMLHEQVGKLIEQQYSEELDRWLNVLAYHYGESTNQEKQRYYFRRAGKAALTAHANETAIHYYQRLLPLLPHHEQIEVLIELGDIWQLIGNWDEAEASYLYAMAQAMNTADWAAQARCEWAQGTLLLLRGLYREARIWLDQAHSSFQQLGDQPGLMQTHRALGNVWQRQGNYSKALDCYEACRDVAMACGDKQSATHAVADMGTIYLLQHEYEKALDCFEQWLYLATELGNKQAAGYMLGQMGHTYWRMGNAQGALFCHEQQIRIAAETGDRRMTCVACAMMAEVYGSIGHTERAIACLVRSLHIAVELGDRPYMMICSNALAINAMHQHRDADAEELFERALTLAHVMQTPLNECDILIGKAMLYWKQKRCDEALMCNRAAMALAEHVQHYEVLFQAKVLAIRLALAIGHITPKQAIIRFEVLATEWITPYEQATIHCELWLLDRTRETDRTQAEALYQTIPPRIIRDNCRCRYEKATGQPIPFTITLSPLPDEITQDSVDLALLLEQVDHAIMHM